jgi:hypothetical protein
VETACWGQDFDMNYPSEGNGDPDRIEHPKVFKIPILDKPNRA